LLVRLIALLPQEINDEQKELVQKLADSGV